MMPFYRSVDPSLYLYHYTSANIASAYILGDKRLRFSNLANTNDPRENKQWFFSGQTGPGEEGGTALHERFSRAWQDANRRLREAAKVLCLTKDARFESFDDLREGIFSRGFSHSRMWAQYAGCHSGVCIGLNRAKFEKAVRSSVPEGYDLYVGDVSYRNCSDLSAYQIDLTLSMDEWIVNHAKNHGSTLWFTKGLDWRDENEFRFVIVKPDAVSEEVYVSIGDSVEAIFLGADCGEPDRSALVRRSLKLHAPVVQMFWRNGEPVVLPTVST